MLAPDAVGATARRAIDTTSILRGPSAAHWAGTDNLGRDIFFRVLVATRLSVELALLATVDRRGQRAAAGRRAVHCSGAGPAGW